MRDADKRRALKKEYEERLAAFQEKRLAALATAGLTPPLHSTGRLSASHRNVTSVLDWFYGSGQDGVTLEPNSPFQCGGDWTLEQQQGFCDSFIRCSLLDAAKEIHLASCDWSWQRAPDATLPANTLWVIDGKQRLAALAKLAQGSILPMGLAWRDLAGTRYCNKAIFQRSVAHNLRIVIHECQYVDQAAQLYLELNAGVMRTQAELQLARDYAQGKLALPRT